MNKIFVIIAVIMFPSVVASSSNDIIFNSDYRQDLFRGFSRDIGVSLSYIPLAPAEALETGHFDVGVELSAADIDETKDHWKFATRDTSPLSFLLFPKAHVQVGLPFNINVGAIYTQVPSSNIHYFGGELKWAFLKGSVSMPAVAIRGTYATLAGVNQLDLNTAGVDISVSKGLLNFTPYAGAGLIFINSTPQNLPAALNLSKVTLMQPKFFAGAKFTLLILNMVAEVDVANIPIYSLRLNFGF